MRNRVTRQIEHAEDQAQEQCAHDRRLDHGRTAAIAPRMSSPHALLLIDLTCGPHRYRIAEKTTVCCG